MEEVKKEIIMDPRSMGKSFDIYRLALQKAIGEKLLVKYVSIMGDVFIMTPEVYKEKLQQERKRTLEEVINSVNCSSIIGDTLYTDKDIVVSLYELKEIVSKLTKKK